MLYRTANEIGNRPNKYFRENVAVGWQTAIYLAKAMLTVTPTDPTLPMLPKPTLQIAKQN